MLSSYRQIFAAPGSLAFSASGLIARMPISMTGVGIVTMLSELRGSYGIAGAVSATLALSAALFGPMVAWLVDRYGQRRVALPATGLTVLAAAALLACAHWSLPSWTLFVTAAGMGVMPSTGSMVRARWAHLYRAEPPKLHTAYSFEAVVDELCFIVGPILAIGLATSVFPEAGLLLAGVFLSVGVALFTAQRRTEPPVHPAAHRTGGSAIRSPGLQVLVITFVSTGAVFGSVEVVTVAFAREQGHPAVASLVLAVYALGSAVAGLVFGTLKLKGSMAGRFLGGIAAMALGMLPLVAAAELFGGYPGLAAVGGALFLAGLSISPTLITAMALVERLVPAAQLTEGMTWTTTGMAAGVALGSAAAGWVVDAAGAPAGYWVPVASAVLGAAGAAAGVRRLGSGLAAAPEQA
ncbi:MFS transporter [Kitasatospora sp. MMS16-BH015]|uniref:MFS transporter n=1 Tax=Kitasatospora sp. MMS16-BH015 TaxID=2018025 RepID=UPI000CA357C8|nr:MFS transporter [Kitasatospora sp. MMS16-BH015]AUG80003.1 MFS transporter [Kitasatospora sp. MMS16-BH015]